MRISILLSAFFWCSLPGWGHAGSVKVSIEIAPGLVAQADCWPGEADKAALLLLHGFLQTRDFPTIRRLAESLADEGFNVLAPSLTLGISRRKQSLSCDALRTHSIGDLAELPTWTRWLAGRSGKPVTVVGYSTGGLQLAAMIEQSGESLPARQAILIGVAYFDEMSEQFDWGALRARAEQADDPDEMGVYTLGFCREYVTTPANLLSYLRWDADHFLDMSYEFDPLDEVLRLLGRSHHG